MCEASQKCSRAGSVVAAMPAFAQCPFSALHLPFMQAVTLEHSLRTELRSLRDEMEESSFSQNINSKQLDSIQAEVPVKVNPVGPHISVNESM